MKKLLLIAGVAVAAGAVVVTLRRFGNNGGGGGWDGNDLSAGDPAQHEHDLDDVLSRETAGK